MDCWRQAVVFPRSPAPKGVQALFAKQKNANPAVVLITGCSSGFGLLTALAFASSGFQVVATMRDSGRSQKLLAAAAEAGCTGLVACKELDITDYDQMTTVVRQCEAEFGGIDVLVNNAGYALGGFTEDVPIEEWSELLRTNVLGAIAMTQAVLPSMRSRRRGVIINVSSISGLMGMPGFAPYVSSKFALEGFSESLRHELYPWGIRVALVEPGPYGTEIWRKGFHSMAGDGSSAYAPQLRQLLDKTKKTAERAADPRIVASAIVRIVRKGAPKLRYPLGRGIRMTLLVRAVLPWRIYETIVQRMIRGKTYNVGYESAPLR